MGLVAARVVVQVFATLVMMVAIAVTVTSIVTPSWQEVYLTEIHVHHYHGLWMDCVKSDRNTQIANLRPFQTNNNHDYQWSCSYKFNQAEGHTHMNNGVEEQHLNLPWHQAVLGLMVASTFFGLISLLFSFCAPCVKQCSIVWAVLSFVATILSAAGVIVFFRNSHEVDYRYITVTQSYEQHLGYSYWCGVAGVLFFLLATVLSTLTTVLLFTANRRSQQSGGKTWPKHHTAV